MRIIGVDFSGAQREVGKTWIARGRLGGNNTLTLENPHRISRLALTNELAGLDEPAVAAMDFPFSVPAEFANCWQEQDVLAAGWGMPNLWAASDTEWAAFEATVFYFGERPRRRDERKWPVRECDKDIPIAQSPLKPEGNPTMLPMTFRGMRVLDCLWRCPAVRVSVPPLPDPSPHGSGEPLTLLEVMPGATLRSFRLPHTGYKDNARFTPEQREQRRETRQYILNELPQRTNPLTVNLPGDVYVSCIGNDDALDAVVAAITAALWAEFPAGFRHPPQPDHPGYQTALLEGWLYAPRILGGNE